MSKRSNSSFSLPHLPYVSQEGSSFPGGSMNRQMVNQPSKQPIFQPSQSRRIGASAMRLPYKRLTSCLNMLLILTLLISLFPPIQPAAAATIEVTPMNEPQAFSPKPVEPAADELTNEVKRLSVQNEIEASSIPPSALSPRSSSVQSGLMFIENVGQFEAKARFMVREGEGSLYLAEDALWLTFLEPITPANRSRLANEPRGVGLDHHLPISDTRRGVNLKLTFPGANPQPRRTGLGWGALRGLLPRR
jgi:hypothetical protein